MKKKSQEDFFLKLQILLSTKALFSENQVERGHTKLSQLRGYIGTVLFYLLFFFYLKKGKKIFSTHQFIVFGVFPVKVILRLRLNILN